MSPVLELRRWTDDDLVVLERQNTPEMMAFLRGPEPAETVARRHGNFLRGQAEGTTFPFAVVVEDETDPVGSIVYWETTHDDRPVYEFGWAILAEHQGNGYAARAVRLGAEHAIEHGLRDELWAFPRIDNLASNALASAAGFALQGEQDFEYPKGAPSASTPGCSTSPPAATPPAEPPLRRLSRPSAG